MAKRNLTLKHFKGEVELGGECSKHAFIYIIQKVFKVFFICLIII